jgi:hypothetical protein
MTRQERRVKASTISNSDSPRIPSEHFPYFSMFHFVIVLQNLRRGTAATASYPVTTWNKTRTCARRPEMPGNASVSSSVDSSGSRQAATLSSPCSRASLSFLLGLHPSFAGSLLRLRVFVADRRGPVLLAYAGDFSPTPLSIFSGIENRRPYLSTF